MINIDDYIKFINDEFKSTLEQDISVSVHDEFYYNDKSNLNVTVKVLPGQIQCGVVQYPVELIIEVNERFTTEVKEFFNVFAIDYNETLITLGGHTFKQFYATPNVIGTFQDKGVTKNTAISVSASLISYDNSLSIKKIVLNSDDLKEEIKPISFVLSYFVETNATGSISDPFTKSVGETVATTYTFTTVPKESELFITIIKLMSLDAKPNKSFELEMYFENFANNKLSIKVPTIIQSGSFSQQTNGLPLLQLTFVRSVN